MKERERRERQNRSTNMQTRHTDKLCSTTSTSLSLFSPEHSAEETEPAGYSNPYTVVSFSGLFEVWILHWRVLVQTLNRGRLTFPKSIWQLEFLWVFYVHTGKTKQKKYQTKSKIGWKHIKQGLKINEVLHLNNIIIHFCKLLPFVQYKREDDFNCSDFVGGNQL